MLDLNETIQELLDHAEVASEMEDWSDAKTFAAQVLDAEPENDEAWAIWVEADHMLESSAWSLQGMLDRLFKISVVVFAAFILLLVLIGFIVSLSI
jgi:hypothetical protein